MDIMTCIAWEREEREALENAIHTFTALDDDAHFGEWTLPDDWRRVAKGVVAGGGPITDSRISDLMRILFVAEGIFEREKEATFWEEKATNEDGIVDLGDISNPMSVKYMAKTLAEARTGFLREVKEAIRLCNRALLAITTKGATVGPL